MSKSHLVELASDLAAAATAAAAWRGMTLDRYVREVLTTAARLDAELAANIKEGEDDFAAGRSYSQAEVEAMFGVHREQRDAA